MLGVDNTFTVHEVETVPVNVTGYEIRTTNIFELTHLRWIIDFDGQIRYIDFPYIFAAPITRGVE